MAKQLIITDELLLDLIHHRLEKEAETRVLEAIDTQPMLSARLQALQEEENLLAAILKTKAPANFSRRVMEALAQPVPGVVPGYLRRQSLILLTGILLALGLITWYLGQGQVDLSAISGWIPSGIEVANRQLPTQPIKKVLQNNQVLDYTIYAGLFLALLLFDRAVLKPYFGKRNQVSQMH
jgi:hypothetical protein